MFGANVPEQKQAVSTYYIYKNPLEEKMTQTDTCPKKGFEIFMQAAQSPKAQAATVAGRGAAPSGRPPNYIPNPELATKNIGSLGRSLNKHCFVWLNKGQQFWFFPNHINEESLSGFRWLNGQWVHKGFEISMIEALYCNG